MKFRLKGVLVLLVLCFCFGIGSTLKAYDEELEGPLNDKEQELADLINQYRSQYNLPAVPVTKSLTKVARLHVLDLNENRPDTGTDSRGIACNLHSWSNQGEWTPVCYTEDHEYAELMWSKPRELTSYSGHGYEIAHFAGMGVTPAMALDWWKNSEPHNNVIINREDWADNFWTAMGVGIDGNYAAVWFGEETDPAGEVSSAPSTPYVAQDHPDGVAAYGGMTLETTKEAYPRGEPVEFILRKVTFGAANLEGCYFIIQIKTAAGWKNYFRSATDGFRTLSLESDKAKKWKWERWHNDRQHKARPGNRFRIQFFAPNQTDDVLTKEFELLR